MRPRTQQRGKVNEKRWQRRAEVQAESERK